MSKVVMIVIGVVLVGGAVLLSFAAHERPTHLIEKPLANVTITG